MPRGRPGRKRVGLQARRAGAPVSHGCDVSRDPSARSTALQLVW